MVYEDFCFLGILALFTIATHGLAKASPGCVANYQNPYYEQARLWVRWQALALRSVAASHSNYGLLFTFKLRVLFVLVCFNTSQLLNVSYLYKAMLQAVRASCFAALHTASRVSWRRAVHFKAMLHAPQGLASCFKALLHAAMCASRRYFALTKAVLHASCSSRRCCVLFKTLLLASRSTCSKLQATTTSHSY